MLRENRACRTRVTRILRGNWNSRLSGRRDTRLASTESFHLQRWHLDDQCVCVCVWETGSGRQMDHLQRHARPPTVSVSVAVAPGGFYLPVDHQCPLSAPPWLVRRRIAYAISATVRRSAKRSDENDNPSSWRSSNLGRRWCCCCCCCWAGVRTFAPSPTPQTVAVHRDTVTTDASAYRPLPAHRRSKHIGNRLHS